MSSIITPFGNNGGGTVEFITKYFNGDYGKNGTNTSPGTYNFYKNNWKCKQIEMTPKKSDWLDPSQGWHFMGISYIITPDLTGCIFFNFSTEEYSDHFKLLFDYYNDGQYDFENKASNEFFIGANFIRFIK